MKRCTVLLWLVLMAEWPEDIGISSIGLGGGAKSQICMLECHWDMEMGSPPKFWHHVWGAPRWGIRGNILTVDTGHQIGGFGKAGGHVAA